MEVTAKKNEQVANMVFAKIYHLYLNRIIKNSRTKEELNQVIEWLTGYDDAQLQQLIDKKVTIETFFENANMHPNTYLIKGVVCGYRIENISDEFITYKHCRAMEKLIDELAKGRKMETILRSVK